MGVRASSFRPTPRALPRICPKGGQKIVFPSFPAFSCFGYCKKSEKMGGNIPCSQKNFLIYFTVIDLSRVLVWWPRNKFYSSAWRDSHSRTRLLAKPHRNFILVVFCFKIAKFSDPNRDLQHNLRFDNPIQELDPNHDFRSESQSGSESQFGSFVMQIIVIQSMAWFVLQIVRKGHKISFQNCDHRSWNRIFFGVHKKSEWLLSAGFGFLHHLLDGG